MERRTVVARGIPGIYMVATSASLLHRVRTNPQSPDWRLLVQLYEPLIRVWLGRQNVTGQDADDISQEVLTVVVRRLPDFEHNQRTGAFRAWLRSITVNCLRDHWRGKKNRPTPGDSELQLWLNQLEDPTSDLSRLWDQEHDRHVTRHLLEQLKREFESKTWQAFSRVALDGVPAAQAAAELGITANAVFIAKSRVLARLRQEAEGLVE
jgi:RNA polymerase sigma factor (sigma-70 family)